jgi:ribosomal-protein-alanine N-acetyltransferase
MMELEPRAVKAPETIETERLLLRRPKRGDAQAVFHRYASDRDVTRYLSWPTHRSIADTLAFLAMSDDEWRRWPAGPYLVLTRDNGVAGALVGSTGLFYKGPTRAITGYVFAKDAWGLGYATEALQAMVDLAHQTGVARLEAICHAEHTPSAHVLEKCGFTREEVCREHFVFPNLKPQKKSDVFSYVRCF